MRRYRNDFDDWRRNITVAERKKKAERETAKLKNAAGVVITGSRIANTLWGKSWCENLERYSDYANRLPRGRNYVRSGCVVDLQIKPGVVNALVSGSVLYRVSVKISPVSAQRWKAICADCAGAIDSLVALLEGSFAKSTMERLCHEKTGLFPHPSEMKFSCTCPDSARMCKHIAAVLYGVGARLDESPELLFTLRKVNQEDLIVHGTHGLTKSKTSKILKNSSLSELFGIEIVEDR